MTQHEWPSGKAALDSGVHLRLNVFGVSTGRTGDCAPGRDGHGPAARRHLANLASRSPYELRDRAAYHRYMAGTATSERGRDDVSAVAQRLNALADRRDAS